MTLGEMQVEAKAHKWKAGRLRLDKAATKEATPKHARILFAERAVKEKLIEAATLANRHCLSLDHIAGKLSKEMR